MEGGVGSRLTTWRGLARVNGAAGIGVPSLSTTVHRQLCEFQPPDTDSCSRAEPGKAQPPTSAPFLNAPECDGVAKW